MKKPFITSVITVIMIGSFLKILPAKAQTMPNWDVTGNYVIAMNYLGGIYAYDMSLVQNNLGNIAGNGGYPAGGSHSYAWALTSGSVASNSIDFYANYTASADAVTPLTVMHMKGAINASGTMSGTWSDNYQGGLRTGTWATASGTAAMASALSVKDFSVMTSDGIRGYSEKLDLTGATFENARLVTVQLFSGSILLQTNTFIGLSTSTEIFSPFDVFGKFDYAADGTWINKKESEYGQTLVPTKVVAIATLVNGKSVMAENVNLLGNPASLILNVASTASIGDVTVSNGTALNALNLSTSNIVFLSDGTTSSLPILWNNGAPLYDGAVAGTYVFAGTLVMPAGIINPSNIVVNTNVTVAAVPVPVIVPSTITSGGGGGGVSYYSPYAIVINNGATSTDSTSVILSLTSLAGMNQMWISNDSSFATSMGTGWVPFQTTYPWTLLPGAGDKIIYVRFSNANTATSMGSAAAKITLVIQGQVLGVSTSTVSQGQVLSTSTFNFTRMLSLGLRGSDVKELQNQLTEEGFYNGLITGYFGSATRLAVKAYQAAHNVRITGIVGSLTMTELNNARAPQIIKISAKKNETLQAQIAGLQEQLLALLQQLAVTLRS